jgi:hypothetical protein
MRSEIWDAFYANLKSHAQSIQKISFGYPFVGNLIQVAFQHFIRKFPPLIPEMTNLEELDLSRMNTETVNELLPQLVVYPNHPTLKKIKLPVRMSEDVLRRYPAIIPLLQNQPDPKDATAIASSSHDQSRQRLSEPPSSGRSASQQTPPLMQQSRTQQFANHHKKPAFDNRAMFKNDLRSFWRFLRNLPAALVGALFSIPLSIFIYNPITCIIGALDGSNWKRYGIPLNLLFILISPLSSIVAFFDNLKDGAKLGYMNGFRAAATFPRTQWKEAPFTTFEIVAPWMSVLVCSAPILGTVIAIKLGLTTIAAATEGWLLGTTTTMGAYLTKSILVVAAAIAMQLCSYAGIAAYSFSRGISEWNKSRENLFPSYYDPQNEMLPRQKEGRDQSYNAMAALLQSDPDRRTGIHDRFKINPHEEMTPCAVSRIFHLPPDPTVKRDRMTISWAVENNDVRQINSRYTFLGREYSISFSNSQEEHISADLDSTDIGRALGNTVF